jgi:BolA protein
MRCTGSTERRLRIAGANITGMSKLERIRAALEALSPTHLEVQDESHMHSRGLETHYKAVIASEAFAGLHLLQRHRQVYRTLGPLMDEIHALAVHPYTPAEWAATGRAPDSPACRGGSRHDKAASSS